MKQVCDLFTWLDHLTYAPNCTALEADTMLPSPYHHFYPCHQVPDNCHQVLGYS